MALATRLVVFCATLLAVMVGTGASVLAPLVRAAWVRPICADPCDKHQIVWVGDILLADKAQPYLDRYGYQWPFDHVRHLLRADFVVGNAESPFTTRREQYFPGQRWHYNTHPRGARALAAVGFGAVSLSNNHALDRGQEGLKDSLDNLISAGIRPFGAGRSHEEAGAPLLIPSRHGTVGVVGLTERWNNGAVAGPDQSGTIPFSDQAIRELRIQALDAGARWVVAFVHWGENYSRISPQQRGFAASFAKAGYDLVIGSQSHVAQDVDIVEGMPVLYSLGNFAFGSSGRYTESVPGHSVVARTYLGPTGFELIELTCILTDNDVVKYQPRPCDASTARTMLTKLGPHVRLHGDRGVVELQSSR